MSALIVVLRGSIDDRTHALHESLSLIAGELS